MTRPKLGLSLAYVKLNAEAVTARRNELGQTQEVLAVRAGISKAALQYLEQGRRQPRGETLAKLAAALGVPVSAITTEGD